MEMQDLSIIQERESCEFSKTRISIDTIITNNDKSRKLGRKSEAGETFAEKNSPRLQFSEKKKPAFESPTFTLLGPDIKKEKSPSQELDGF